MENDTTTTAPVTTTAPAPAPSKQELLDAKRREARQVKATEKAARKAANAAKRQDGVIGTIRSMLEQPTGATRREVLDALTVKFPTRDPLGMAVTVGIQFSRLAKVGGAIGNYKHATRGRVYGFDKTLQRPEVVLENTPAPTVAPAPLEDHEEEEQGYQNKMDAMDAEDAKVAKGKGGKGKGK